MTQANIYSRGLWCDRCNHCADLLIFQNSFQDRCWKSFCFKRFQKQFSGLHINCIVVTDNPFSYPYDLQLRSQIRFSILPKNRSSAEAFECALDKIFKPSIQNLPSSTFKTVFALLWFCTKKKNKQKWTCALDRRWTQMNL